MNEAIDPGMLGKFLNNNIFCRFKCWEGCLDTMGDPSRITLKETFRSNVCCKLEQKTDPLAHCLQFCY